MASDRRQPFVVSPRFSNCSRPQATLRSCYRLSYTTPHVVRLKSLVDSAVCGSFEITQLEITQLEIGKGHEAVGPCHRFLLPNERGPTFMKRLGVFVASAFLGSIFV